MIVLFNPSSSIIFGSHCNSFFARVISGFRCKGSSSGKGLKIILDEADLMNIVTKKCCRHEGIASNIMDKLIEYCKQEKIKCINLEVNIQNSIAINFYKKYNFKEVGLRKKYYDNTYDAILMKLEF